MSFLNEVSSVAYTAAILLLSRPDIKSARKVCRIEKVAERKEGASEGEV